jgi:hypothetical protein
MAPTGETMSWHTRLHKSAARSRSLRRFDIRGPQVGDDDPHESPIMVVSGANLL